MTSTLFLVYPLIFLAAGWVFREGLEEGPETDLSRDTVLFGGGARFWRLSEGVSETGAGCAQSSLAAIGLPLGLPSALPLGSVTSD